MLTPFLLLSASSVVQVYKGRRRYSSQIVALKFITKKGKSEKALAELRREIHILASLSDCAYVIRLLDWFETRSEICVVTEYAQGELYEILTDDGSLSESTVRRIAIQLMHALQWLHSNRIIQSDAEGRQHARDKLGKLAGPTSHPCLLLSLPLSAPAAI